MPNSSRETLRMDTQFCCRWLIAAMLLAACGCGSLERPQFPGLGAPAGTNSAKEEEDYRTRYQTQRDPEALAWLLANRLQTGMSLQEVERVLGEDGVREANDLWIKTGGGHYRAGDVIYHWGPDNEGKRVYLGFREELLVNFDPREYAAK